MNQAANAINRVNELLNKGLISVEDGYFEVTAYQGNLAQERQTLEALSHALSGLAEAMAGEGISCNDRLPTEDDANSHGDVEWCRSGRWMRGRVLLGQPVDATHWRPILS